MSNKSKSVDVSIDMVSPRAILRAFNDGLEKHYSDLTGLYCPEPTLAQQQFADDSNPNVIMEKFAKTGNIELLTGAGKAPSYGDFTEATDYHSALNVVIAAQDAFMSLDAKLRARFDNDPGVFLDFVENPENYDELVKLGLAVGKSATPREPINAGGVDDLSIAGSADKSLKNNDKAPAALKE